MGLDLRDTLRSQLRAHRRIAQQGLFAREGDGARIAATLPPLVPFGSSKYEDCVWIVDWDHRLPSRQAVLRVYAHYTKEKRELFEEAYAARIAEMSKEDLFPEFDVSDFLGLPSDEAYEADLDLTGSPARLRLVSDWRREIHPVPAANAIEIVRESQPFRELRSHTKVRAPGLGDLEPAEWSPPCESGHVRWGVDVWYLMTFNGMVGEGRAFLVDLEEKCVVRERDFQFRAG